MVKKKGRLNLPLLILTISLALVGGLAVSGILTTSRTLGTSGTVKAINVEVYWDLLCTEPVNEIDWGFCEPGSDVVKTVYVKNGGNAPMTLNMSYSGWNPVEAGSYLTLSWDQGGVELAAGGVVEAVLTLSISNEITGITDFSFDILIEGTG